MPTIKCRRRGRVSSVRKKHFIVFLGSLLFPSSLDTRYFLLSLDTRHSFVTRPSTPDTSKKRGGKNCFLPPLFFVRLGSLLDDGELYPSVLGTTLLGLVVCNGFTVTVALNHHPVTRNVIFVLDILLGALGPLHR